MTIRFAGALLLFGLAACSTPETDDSAEADTGAADATQFETAVRCQANFDAVSRLYSALSSQSEGAEGAELSATAAARELAANAFRDQARATGAKLGHSAAFVDDAFKTADAAVQAKYDKSEFEDFATWVSREADGCPRPGA